MPRFTGGRSLTFLPAMLMSPEVTSSSPAIMRSSVDLPQPDGPTNTTNWPSATSRSMPLMISAGPKVLTSRLRLSSDMGDASPLLRARGPPLHGSGGRDHDLLELLDVGRSLVQGSGGLGGAGHDRLHHFD